MPRLNLPNRSGSDTWIIATSTGIRRFRKKMGSGNGKAVYNCIQGTVPEPSHSAAGKECLDSEPAPWIRGQSGRFCSSNKLHKFHVFSVRSFQGPKYCLRFGAKTPNVNSVTVPDLLRRFGGGDQFRGVLILPALSLSCRSHLFVASPVP